KGFEDRRLYFKSGQGLSESRPEGASGSDSYKVDFTATTGESNRWRTNLGGGRIAYPNRAEEDKKLLVYTSEALTEDVEITGVPVVTLNMSSSAEDGAFYVYLEDVAPDGKVTYVTEGELRAVHRQVTEGDQGHAVLGPKHSFVEKDGKLLVPGENTEIKIGMQATSVLLKKGHSIRIAIAGHDCSNFRKIAEADTPVINVQRDEEFSSFVELPMKIRD
ncbi:MAG: CocE/NonD family hydrolase, partial [Pseudomonadota bacterium]